MTTTSQRSGRPAPRPEYRHATTVPAPWVEQMLNPLGWRAGHWAFFVAALTAVADAIVVLYLFNFFGLTLALYAIVYRSGRVTGVFALVFALIFGAAPAWLVGNTIVQLVLNGGQLPYAPIDW